MKKVFVLGIDGLCVPIWNYLISENLIPNLSQVISSVGPLKSTTPPHSAPAWTSISTGLNPGRHGILDFWERVQLDSRSNSTIRPFTSSDKITFWELASLQGAKVGVFNYPLSYPPRAIDGYWLSGLNSPPKAVDYVYPNSLISIVAGFKPETAVIGEIMTKTWLSHDDRLTALKAFTELLKHHLDTGKKILSNPIDREVLLHVYVLTAIDRFLHLFYDTLSEQKTEIPVEIHKAVRDFWTTLDTGISNWLDIARPDTVLLTSDHGFSRYPLMAFNFSKWLNENDIVSDQALATSLGRFARFAHSSLGFKLALENHLPERAKSFIRSVLKKNSQRAYERSSEPVPELLYGSILGITVNRTRNPQAEIASQIELLHRRILDKIRDCRDINHESIILSAHKAADIWWGEHLTIFPDIVVFLHENYGGTIGSSDPRLLIPVHSARTGDHSPIGIIGFSHDITTLVPEENSPSVWDVPAIALHELGVKIPRYFDGRVPNWVIGTPQYTSEIEDPNIVNRQYTSAEATDITNRLRALGYHD